MIYFNSCFIACLPFFPIVFERLFLLSLALILIERGNIRRFTKKIVYKVILKPIRLILPSERKRKQRYSHHPWSEHCALSLEYHSKPQGPSDRWITYKFFWKVGKGNRFLEDKLFWTVKLNFIEVHYWQLSSMVTAFWKWAIYLVKLKQIIYEKKNPKKYTRTVLNYIYYGAIYIYIYYQVKITHVTYLPFLTFTAP